MSSLQIVLLALLAVVGPGILLALVWSSESRAGLLGFLEFSLRRLQARFHPRPASAWIAWARKAHRGSLARLYLAEAARTGDPEGILEEGLLFWEGGWGPGGQQAGALRFRRAALAGHPDAMYWLAESLRWGGAGPRPSPDEAMEWLRRGAEKGSGACMDSLVRLLAPREEEVSRAEAARWKARLESSGANPAPRRSALAPSQEASGADPLVRATREAVAQAEAWFERPEILPFLPWIAWTGIGLLGAAGIAMLLLPIFFGGIFAIPLLVSFAMLVPMAVRWRLENRPGVAIRLHFDRAQAGDPAAAYFMGMASMKGEHGLPKDAADARRWLRQAAEGGHLEAMVELAALLRWDLGGMRNPAEADGWLRRAAELGHEKALQQIQGARRAEPDDEPSPN